MCSSNNTPKTLDEIRDTSITYLSEKAAKAINENGGVDAVSRALASAGYPEE